MKIEDILGLAVPASYLAMLLAERLFPARPFPKVKGWTFVGIAFLVLMMTGGIVTPLLLPVDWIAAHRLMDGTKLGIVGGTVVGFLVLELVAYFYHRACHNVPLLWRMLHQMHHAPKRLDISGSFVFHPTEILMQNVLSIGVTVFVLGLEPVAAALVGTVLAFYALFQHWNVKTPRWLGYVIQRPESHGMHHELGVHANNYADLPLIDLAFGTFHNPEKFDGNVGFEGKVSYANMLAFVDVNEGQDAGQPFLGRATRSPLSLR